MAMIDVKALRPLGLHGDLPDTVHRRFACALDCVA
jgi:hypothetical protein